MSPLERDAIPHSLLDASETAVVEIDDAVGAVTLVDCPFRCTSGCGIYGHRPLVCRAVGAVEETFILQCPRGVRAEKPLSEHEAIAILDHYKAIAGSRLVPPTFRLGGRTIRDPKVSKAARAVAKIPLAE